MPSGMHRAVSFARDLIAIPSVNPMGKNVSGEIYSEKRVAEYIAAFLRSAGIDFEIDESLPGHPNLIATMDAGCTETNLLDGHMDTVSHENMTIDPFDPRIENGLLYGRGSCDTKSSLAVYLSAIEELIKKRYALKRNLIVAFTHNEESTFSGAEQFAATNPRASFAVTGEPTSLNIIFAHKGICRFTMTTAGTSAHAALPWLGDNAIYKMGRVVHLLQSYAANLEKTKHPRLGSATLNVGRISGGETVNTVPSSCTIEIDHRLLPGDTYRSISKNIREHIGAAVEYEMSAPFLEAGCVINEPDGPACTELRAACREADWDPELLTAHYGTNGSVYSRIGIPTVVFGPGDIKLAHSACEYVPVKEIETAHRIVLNLLKKA